MGVINAIALQAAPIKGEAMRHTTYRIDLESVSRRSALRIISAFRTFSIDAALVIAKTMPVYIAVDEERRKHLNRVQTELDQLEDRSTNSWLHA